MKSPRTVTAPCVTSDYFPTVVDALGLDKPDADSRPHDGESLLPLIDGRTKTRLEPIAFQSRRQQTLVDNRYKLYSSNAGKTYELYDLTTDPGEKTDLARKRPEVVAQMRKTLGEWLESCEGSAKGGDYGG